MKSYPLLLIAPLITPTFAGDGAKAVISSLGEPTSGWSIRSVSAGPAWRSLGSLDYRGASRSQNLMIPSFVGGSVLNTPAIGASDTIGNRIYDNGFVNVDGTGSVGGDTLFWGYQTSDQEQGDSLIFNATGNRSDFSQSNTFSGEFSRNENLDALTPQIDLLLNRPAHLNLPFDGVLVSFWGFSTDTNNQFSNFSGTQTREDYRLDFVDTYDISAITPLITAPYAGSSGGPGPLISNLPANRSETDVLIGGDSASISNSVSTSLDLDGYSLALGPTWSGKIRSNWSWQASAGLTLNVFRWSSSETETLSYSVNGGHATQFRQWRDSNSGTDFRVGVYAKGEVIRQINDAWLIKSFFQAETAGSIDMSVGDSVYEFQPRGFAVGLSAGYSF